MKVRVFGREMDVIEVREYRMGTTGRLWAYVSVGNSNVVTAVLVSEIVVAS